MNDYFDKVLSFFPNLPREVYDSWLHYRILEYGWPPRGETWKNVLREFDLSYWSQLKWIKKELDIKKLDWSRNALHIMKDLFEANYLNKKNRFSKFSAIVNSKDKIEKAIEYIEIHGCLPETIIVINDKGKYEIVDGCHRLTAFLRYVDINEATNRLNIIQNVWIGKL